MSTVEEARPRSYGNILKPRSAGLWHLGLLSTGMALGLFVVDVIVMFVAGVIPGVAAIVVTIPTVFLLLRPDVHGRTGAAKLTEAVTGRVSGRKAGYRSGPTSLDPRGQHRLPGILGVVCAVGGRGRVRAAVRGSHIPVGGAFDGRAGDRA